MNTLIDNEQLLEKLYEQERKLHEQFLATQQAIVGFGGTPQLTVELNSNKAENVVTLPTVDEKTDDSKNKEEKEEISTKETSIGTRNKLEDVHWLICEILETNPRNFTAKQLARKMNRDHDLFYEAHTIASYLSVLTKKGRVRRVKHGLYARVLKRDKKKLTEEKKSDKKASPTVLQKSVISIKEVKTYIKLRKEVTRKELIEFFVKGGLMVEHKLQTRIQSLIKEGHVARKEDGVYRWVKDVV